CWASRQINQSRAYQPPQRDLEMPRRAGAVGAFEPVLVEERGQGGLSQFRFPQNAEQRRHRFLTFARRAGEQRRALSRGAMAGFWAGAEPELIGAAPTRSPICQCATSCSST